MPVTETADRDRPAGTVADIVDVTWVSSEGAMAGWVRLDLRSDRTRFLAAILRSGELPVVVLDHELPVATRALEFRAPGVWVELCCETPLDHWTVGLEAFGLAVDPGEVITPDTLGDRVPVGLDLDLDTVAAPDGDDASFSIGVRVHGEVLIAEAAYEIDGHGMRTRTTTGRRPHLPLGVTTAPTHGELAVAWPVDDGLPAVERRAWVGGSLPGWVTLEA